MSVLFVTVALTRWSRGYTPNCGARIIATIYPCRLKIFVLTIKREKIVHILPSLDMNNVQCVKYCFKYEIIQICVVAVKCRLVLQHCVLDLLGLWIVCCFYLKIESAHAQGASMEWYFHLYL